MITKIESISDVKKFANQLIEEGVSMHPDDDFNDIIEFKTGRKYYTAKDTDLRNWLMDRSFKVCEKENEDIYVIFNVILRKYLGFSDE